MSANKPNIEQIRKYLNGELDARAMYKLEREAQNDPFLWDVIRGIESGNEDHRPNLDAIEQLIHKRVAQDKKRIIPMWKLLPVAASLLIALGIGGWWLTHKHQEPVTVVNTPKVIAPDKVKINSADTVKPIIQVDNPPMVAQLNQGKHRPATTLKPALPLATNEAEAKADTVKYKDLAYNAPANQGLLKEVSVDKNIGKRSSTSASAAKLAALDTGLFYKKTASKLPDTLSRVLEGRVAGVEVNNGFARNGQNIAIRGSSSLPPGLEPLYIVDGKLAQDFKLGSIKPADIKSIDILKDSTATAIYGSRASDGVIIVNTKNGFRRIGDGKTRRSAVGAGANDTSRNKTLASAQAVDAQLKNKAERTKVINGKVIDKDGHGALPGVMVKVDGSNIATTTDMNGKFIVTLPTGKEILNIAYIGYNSQQVKVNNRDSLKVMLSPNTQSLNEVVVVGYGAKKDEEYVAVENASPAIGWKAYNKYLKDNATMPNGQTGTVKLSFMVNGSGQISDIRIVKGLSDDMNSKAIDLIKKGSGWNAESDGKDQKIKISIKFHK